MLDEADEMTEDVLVSGAQDAERVPPARRGSRDERREVTLRALAGGQDAYCAYCGRQLPPLPPKGGRPTPYCPPDPDHYGRWGAKVISCAMLDEQREIWVRVYGPDQPMTQVDVRTLDNRVSALLGALDPVRDEVRALQSRVADETTAALAAKDTAERSRDEALEQARVTVTERADAVAQAEHARQQAERDRMELRAAQDLSATAVREAAAALDARRAAERDRDKADADRQRALDQVAATQDRITELQTTLAGERATALERLDRLRQDEDQARQDLRASLTADYEQRLRARANEFDEQILTGRAAADQRVADLTGQLTQATRTYADTLAPLHAQLGVLRGELAERTATVTALRQQLDDLRAAPKPPPEPSVEPSPESSPESPRRG
jgi:hypothetical protein